jgi:reactive intermediate/imine deaminase
MKYVSLILLAFAVNASFALNAQQTPTQSGAVLEYLGRSGTAPLSEAVRIGSVLYLSGQLGTANGSIVTGGVKAETKQALENIKSVLEKNSSGMDHVIKCTVMLADIADRPAMNEVYVTYFPKDRLPTRSTFGTTGLALGARVEIECMAALK